MKALVLDKPGKPNTLYLTNVAKPEPDKGEVRVKVEAVALNPVDYKIAQGGHPVWRYPFILGLDVAGIIDAVGPDVDQWQVGDRVFYHGNLSRPGGFAEYTISVAHVLARIPANISFVEAAALPCAGLTAYQALVRKLHIQSNQTVFIQGGAGGVGGFGVQLAAQAGATVITTASRHNFDYVKNLGASQVIDYRQEDVTHRIQEITDNQGVDAILNTVDSASATVDTKLLAFGGGLACIAGMPDFSQVSFDKAISIHAVMLGGVYFSGDRAAQSDLGRMAAELISLMTDDKLDPMINRIISLDQIPKALIELSKRHVRGKIVATL